jgi:hypothetical protein
MASTASSTSSEDTLALISLHLYPYNILALSAASAVYSLPTRLGSHSGAPTGSSLAVCRFHPPLYHLGFLSIVAARATPQEFARKELVA